MALVLGLSLTAGLAACGNNTTAGAGSGGGSSGTFPISYGVVLPFSGASAFIGQIGNAGVYPAANEINAAGGVLGHKIDVKDIDTKGDPADALPTFQQYAGTTSHIFGINGPSSTEGPALVPVVNRNKISMIATAGEAQFDHSTLPYFWRLVPPDPSNGAAMAIQAKREGLTRVAAVFGSDAGSQGDLPGVVAGVKAEGLDLVSNVTLSPDQPSYASQVARVLASNPQVIMTESDPTTAATFFGELSQQTQKPIKIFGTAVTVTASYLKPVQGAMGASRFAKAFQGVAIQSSPPNAATTEFNKELVASGSQVPKPKQWLGNSYAEHNYDGLILQALAAVDAGSWKSSAYNSDILDVSKAGPGRTPVYTYARGVKLLKEHKKIQYIGAAGPFHFDKYHNSYSGDVVQRYTSSGKLVTVATITQSQLAAVKVK